MFVADALAFRGAENTAQKSRASFILIEVGQGWFGLDGLGLPRSEIAMAETQQMLTNPTRHLFLTGKGGVGKTSLSCASAITLCDGGKKVLLVSTDLASNLDEMLATPLRDLPTPVSSVPGLYAMNINPEAAAEDYRQRVLAQMAANASESERNTVREQLSGACTTDVAASDAFVGLLADDMSCRLAASSRSADQPAAIGSMSFYVWAWACLQNKPGQAIKQRIE
mgnify:CR=1 FL=1